MALPMASGVERMSSPFSHTGLGPEIPLSIADDLLGVDARAQGQGDQAADRLGLGGGIATGLADSAKHLAQAFFVFVDGYVDFAFTGTDALGETGSDCWALPWGVVVLPSWGLRH